MNSLANTGNMTFQKNESIDVEILSPEVCETQDIGSTVRMATENLINTALYTVAKLDPTREIKVKTITLQQHFAVIPTRITCSVDLKD